MAGARLSPQGARAAANAFQPNRAKVGARNRQVERLRTRSAFRAAASGRRISRPGFVLQAVTTECEGPRAPRFGFTVTKKIGNSVTRNRIRRRLKEAVRLAGAEHDKSATDYVLIGRRAALSLEFDRLVTDLLTAIAALSKQDQAQPKRARKAVDA